MRFLPLLIEALAVAIVVIGPRGRARFDALGVQFVLIAAFYHGLTEAVQSVFPDANNVYRNLVTDADVNSWLWIMSNSLLAFACAYVASSRLRGKCVSPITSSEASRPPLWFWLALTVPIYLIAVSGVDDDSYWAGGLAQQFILLSMTLASVACVEAGAPLLSTMVIQTAAASLLASRLNVAASAIMLLTALYAVGKRIRFRDCLTSGLLVVLVLLTISLARASVGRQQLLGGIADRADGIAKGAALLVGGKGAEDLVDDFVYRFDGNTFPAMIDRQYENGDSPAGMWPLVNDLWVTVPSFLNPPKLDADVTRRNDRAYLNDWFGLPTAIDVIPTQLGILYGSTGVILFPLALVLCGGLAESIDSRLGRLRSADGLVLKLALCQANVFMETGFIVYPYALRGALTLIVVLRLVAALNRIVLPMMRAGQKRARLAPRGVNLETDRFALK